MMVFAGNEQTAAATLETIAKNEKDDASKGEYYLVVLFLSNAPYP